MQRWSLKVLSALPHWKNPDILIYVLLKTNKQTKTIEDNNGFPVDWDRRTLIVISSFGLYIRQP